MKIHHLKSNSQYSPRTDLFKDDKLKCYQNMTNLINIRMTLITKTNTAEYSPLAREMDISKATPVRSKSHGLIL